MTKTLLTACAFFALACGGKAASTTTGPTTDDPGAVRAPVAVAAGSAARIPTDGDMWTCRIGDYEPQPCRFNGRPNTGTYELTKLMGSVRFEGIAEFAGETDSFRFTGKQFCPWGACDETLDLTFTWDAVNSAYVANTSDEPWFIRWDADAAAAYGTAGYGGLTGHEQ